jgi:predicted DNA-binding transcriptional regulator AlpA
MTAAPRSNTTRSRTAGRHLTVADVCEELGITRSTFYDWRVKQKAPPCFRLPNGELRIKREDYLDWLADLCEQAA